MSDEPTGELTPETPSAPTEPTETQPTPPVPPKFEGKTPEELTSILQDRDKVIGRQGQELGQLREAVERLYAERSPERPQPGPPKFNYEDPDKSIDEKIEARIAMERAQYQQARVVDVATRTTQAFQDGVEIMKQNPHLFAGIEDQVRQGIAQVYGPMAASGQDVSNYLRNPKVWKAAAIAVRADRGEFDDKFKAPGTKGMAFQPTDLPGQTRPTQDDDGIIIEDSDRKEYEDFYDKKGTDKEIRELLKKGMATQRRR